jgi:phosphoglycerate dehydrogenase-like enzyme
MKKKILITEFMEEKSIILLRKYFNIIYEPQLWQKDQELEDKIHECHGIIVRNKSKINKKILSKAINLKFVGRLGVGLDNIDTDFCAIKNIHVQPAVGMNADSVAEYVLNCSLSLLKNIPLMHEGTKLGHWPRTTIISREIQGKTLGLLGFGFIAKKVCKIAQAFGVKIIAYDPYVSNDVENEYKINLVEINDIYLSSDIISVHLPLTKETKNLLNFKTFLSMKKNPIIINSSRGTIINETDLLRAYDEKLICGFALDVYEEEPIKKKFYNQINTSMNCILTPHVAGVTTESNIRVSDFITRSAINFFIN